MAEESSEIKDKADGFKPSVDKKVILAVLGVIVLVAAGAYYMSMEQPSTAPEESPEQDNAPAEENRSVGLSPSDIEGEISRVNITNVQAEPASLRIAPEDGVEFFNVAGVDVTFSFDREIPNFNLSAGESIIVDPTSIVYYEVAAQNPDADFRGISARINVQG